MLVIGFIGYKNSGKTTACNIVRRHIEAVIQHNFKDGLVEEMKKNLPDTLKILSNLEGMMRFLDSNKYSVEQLFKDKPPLMRALMQNYGTEVRRGDNPNYWVDRWIERLPEGNVELILTDDVRFKNEAMAVKSQGGILIRLIRPDMVNTDKHQSEVEQDSIVADYEIVSRWGEESVLESKLMDIIKANI